MRHGVDMIMMYIIATMPEPFNADHFICNQFALHGLFHQQNLALYYSQKYEYFEWIHILVSNVMYDIMYYRYVQNN